MSDKQDQQAIDDVAKALKQVLSVKPQLLYKAAGKCYADYFLDRIKYELENRPMTAEAMLIRGAICQLIASTLIRSGRAHLDDEDVANMVFAAQFMSKEPTPADNS